MRLSPALGSLVLLAACSPAVVPLQAPPGAAIARVDDYPRPVLGALPPMEGERHLAGNCGIERIEGAGSTRETADGTFVVDLPARAMGWAFAPDEVPGVPETWLRLVPLAPGGSAAQFPLVAHFPRPDVVAALSAPRAAYSGFAPVTIDGLAPGAYHAQVVFASREGRWVCSNIRQVVVE